MATQQTGETIVTVRLPQAKHAGIVFLSADAGLTKSEIIRKLIPDTAVAMALADLFEDMGPSNCSGAETPADLLMVLLGRHLKQAMQNDSEYPLAESQLSLRSPEDICLLFHYWTRAKSGEGHFELRPVKVNGKAAGYILTKKAEGEK